MRVRAQIAKVFHLDKCIGCHTCSVSCKSQWTDRPGLAYAWWNNVETKPGTGYPVSWEDQEQYEGGWRLDRGRPALRQGGRLSSLARVFSNPKLPALEDYYEPFTYRYQDLFDAKASDDQPTARPVSLVDGKPIEIRSGPNWDDDLSGSPVYAANDPNLAGLTPRERADLQTVERMVFFYLPRSCNHCLNAACVAACPSGAISRRGEDGIVLVNQDRCRGWRLCVSACPYKKTYFNLATKKSEKCIACYPRLEAGEPPACFQTCVGRIRYLGVLLYDADGLEKTASAPDAELVAAQRELILDPHDPAVAEAASRSGVSEGVVEAARRSPVFRFVKEWEIALPLHPEYRTLPMLFYVPPLLPAMRRVAGEKDGLFTSLEKARLPLRYLANLFAAGNEEPVHAAYRKLMAVRLHRRAATVGDLPAEAAARALAEAGLSPAEADAIYRLTALAGMEERIVVPPMAREAALDGAAAEPQPQNADGFGRLRPPAAR